MYRVSFVGEWTISLKTSSPCPFNNWFICCVIRWIRINTGPFIFCNNIVNIRQIISIMFLEMCSFMHIARHVYHLSNCCTLQNRPHSAMACVMLTTTVLTGHPSVIRPPSACPMMQCGVWRLYRVKDGRRLAAVSAVNWWPADVIANPLLISAHWAEPSKSWFGDLR